MDGNPKQMPTLEPALASMYYLSPENFRREHERIFYRSWLVFCHDSDLPEPGAFLAGHVADQPIFAIRGHDGVVRAFYNTCRHRAHRIVEGAGIAERLLVCPYHAWSYEHSGLLRSARGAERGQDRATLGLCAVRIEQIAGFWYVNLDQDAPTLAETALGLEDQIRTHSPAIGEYVRLCEASFEIACNWKVYVENALECYHCAPAHPGFCETVDLDAYEIAASANYTRHWGRMKSGGEYSSWKLFPMSGLRATTAPNTATMFQIRPLAPERIISTLTLFGPVEMAGDREALRRDWVDTSFVHEDIALSESVQIGLHSRGFPGALIMRSTGYESEHLLAEFQSWVKARMEA